MTLKKWKTVFRKGIAPNLPTEGILALRDALKNDDSSLIQGTTCYPKTSGVLHPDAVRCQAACAISFCGWQSGKENIQDVEDFLEDVCDACDRMMGGCGSPDFIQ